MGALPKTRELVTERLVLRPLRVQDAVQTQPLFARWEIVQYLNGVIPWPFPADGAERYYRDLAVPAMERGDEWHWTLRLREEPLRIVGAIGLMTREDENRGFWLGEPWQRRGLMTEAVIAANDFLVRGAWLSGAADAEGGGERGFAGDLREDRDAVSWRSREGVRLRRAAGGEVGAHC